CCLPSGGCIMIDPICCDDQGGIAHGLGSVCLGDNDNDGIDDACQYKNWVVADDFNLGCRNCRCDVNGDGVCDQQDRGCLQSCIPPAFPVCPDCSRADLNCDSIVDN